MLPTIMSQIGMSSDLSFGGEGAQRKTGTQEQSGEGQTTTNEQPAGDDDVPGMFIATFLAVKRQFK